MPEEIKTQQLQPEDVSAPGIAFVDKTSESQTIAASDQEPAVQLVQVKNSLSDGMRTVAKDSKGRFTKKRSKLDQELKSSEKLEKEIQAVLDSPVMVDGKPLVDPKTNKPISMHTAVEQNLLEICRTSKDPKMLSGAAKLLDILFTRAHGRVKESPANRDALITSGITTVFIGIPQGIPEAKPEELNSPRPLLPSFAEPATINAEIVQQNSAPKAPRGRPKAIEPELITEEIPSR